jgi:hypothetical protein
VSDQRARVTIDREGQKFVDQPVYVLVSEAKKLALEINAIFRPKKASTPALRLQPRIEQLSHYERFRLRWMQPDGRGGLVPKHERT